MSLELSYVLPLRTPCPAPAEFTAYLDALSGWVDDVIVVDGSEPAVREHHRCVWPSTVSVLEPARCTLMGKVGGVVTGVAAARHEKVVVADDDVRYDREALERIARASTRPTSFARRTTSSPGCGTPSSTRRDRR